MLSSSVHYFSFPASSRLLPSFLHQPSADLHPCAGACLLTNGLQEKSKESPVRVRQARAFAALWRCGGWGWGGGAPRVLMWTQRSMFSSDTAERAMTVNSQKMIITHCLSHAGVRPGRQIKRVFPGIANRKAIRTRLTYSISGLLIRSELLSVVFTGRHTKSRDVKTEAGSLAQRQ